jgi:hypothetical protein
MNETVVWSILAILFSGAGIAIFKWIKRKFFKKKRASSLQEISSGSGSTNIIASGDVNIGGNIKSENLSTNKTNDVEQN